MERLPNSTQASIPKSKVADYLLNLNHPTGRSKAAFFLRFGFRREDWEQCARALHRHAQTAEVIRFETTPFGKRYTLRGEIESPDGRNPTILSGWMIDKSGLPRFVTAIPVGRSKGHSDD